MRPLSLAAAVLLAGLALAGSDASTARDDAFDFANGLYVRGMYDLAATEYRSFMSAYPDDPELATARLRLAECLYMEEGYEAALPIYADLARSGGEAAPAAAAREGMCLVGLARWEDAAKRLAELPDGVPPGLLASALSARAVAAARLDRTDEELACLQQASEVKEGGSPAFIAGMKLSERLAALGRRDESDAALRRLMDGPWSAEERGAAGVRLAEGLYERGDYEGALAAYDEVTAKFPETLVARRASFGRLWPLYSLGRDEDVLKGAEALLKGFPDDESASQAVYLKGSALFRLKRFREAVAELSRAAVGYQGSRWGIEAASKVGWAELALGEPDMALHKADELLSLEALSGAKRAELELLAGQAVEALKGEAGAEAASERYGHAIEADPQGPLAAEALYRLGFALNRLGKTKEAVASLARIADEYPASHYAPMGLLDAARVALAAGDWEGAESRARAFIQKYGDSEHVPAACDALGTALYNTGRYDEMAKVYAELLDKYPDSPQAAAAAYWLGWDGLRRGNPGEAAPKFELVAEGLGQNPYRADSLVRLGIARIALGDEAAAAAAFIKAHDESLPLPDEQAIWLGQWLLARGEGERAGEVFKRIVDSSLDPESAQAGLAGLGEALWIMGRTEDARQTFEKLLADYPDGPYRGEAHLGLGRLARGAGRQDEARGSFEAAVASSTGRAAALALLELAAMDSEGGDHGEAARCYLRVAILYPFENLAARALLGAGRELEAAGDPEQAVKSYEELLEKFPGSPEAGEATAAVEEARRRIQEAAGSSKGGGK